MTSRGQEYVEYVPILPQNNDQNVVVLLPRYERGQRRPRRSLSNLCDTHLCWIFFFCSAVILLAVAFFFLYPANPSLQLSRVHLNHIRVNSSPKLTLDLSFNLTIKVRNRDFFSLEYDSLVVSVGYRGRELGFVRSSGGKLRARASSYVSATLDLNGLEIIHDVIYLISDFASGVIPFDTDTEIKGHFGVLFFKIPMQGRVLCEVYVNTKNQSVVREDCSYALRDSTGIPERHHCIILDKPEHILKLLSEQQRVENSTSCLSVNSSLAF